MSIDDIVQIYVNGFGQPLGSGGSIINLNALPQRVTSLISNVALNIGDCVTLAPGGRCTLATAANLAFGGAVIGVCILPAFANSLAIIQFDGVLDVAVTGLSGSGPTRVNTTTGRLEVVSQFASADYPVGYSYGGYVAMVRGLAIGVPTSYNYSQAPGYFDDFSADNAVNSGGLVSAWPSSVGSTSLVQATSGNRPTFVANELNGHPGVQGNGVNQWLESSTWGMAGSTNWTFYMIIKDLGTQAASGSIIYGSAAGGGTRATFCFDNQTGADIGQYRLERTGTNTFPNNGRTYAADMRGAGYHLVSGQWRSDGTNELFVDGASRGIWNNSDVICYNFLTLFRYQGAILPTNVSVVRLINYNAAHAISDRQNLETKFHLDYPGLP